MDFYLHQQKLKHTDVWVLAFDTAERSMVFWSHAGAYREWSFDALGDLIDSECLAVFVLPNDDALLVNAHGRSVYHLNADEGELNPVATIRRTEDVEEGYDYCDFTANEYGIFLFYECGAIRFSETGMLLWQVDFPERLTCCSYSIAGQIAVYSDFKPRFKVFLEQGLLEAFFEETQNYKDG